MDDGHFTEGLDSPPINEGMKRLATRFLWACIRDAYSGRRLARKRVQAWLRQPEQWDFSPHVIGALLGIRPQLIIRALQKALDTPSASGGVQTPRSLAKFVVWAKQLPGSPDADESSRRS